MLRAVAVLQSDKVKGQVLFRQNGTNVEVQADFTELPPGDHGFHIHKAGDLRGEGCKGACDHFTYGADSTEHGGPPPPSGESGPRHTGDLGNIRVGHYEFLLKNLPIEELYGRSVIVHQDPDDLGQGGYEDSKTTGHSGARIGCAVIGRILCQETSGGKRRRRRTQRRSKN